MKGIIYFIIGYFGITMLLLFNMDATGNSMPDWVRNTLNGYSNVHWVSSRELLVKAVVPRIKGKSLEYTCKKALSEAGKLGSDVTKNVYEVSSVYQEAKFFNKDICAVVLKGIIKRKLK